MSDKSAKQVIRESMFSALVEALNSLRKDNVDQALLREVKAIHGNTTFGDLPESVRSALNMAVENHLLKLKAEGYRVSTID